ncbi:MAG: hypothetical protein ACRCYE_14570 [Sarcina sp.]
MTRKSRERVEETSKLPALFICKGSDLNYSVPNLFNGGSKRTFTQIRNACNEVLGDKFGNVYIKTSYLDVILRTKKFVVNEILFNMPDDEKVYCDGETYVKYGHIMKLISERLQCVGSSKTREYLLLVEEFLLNIRDSEKLLTFRNQIESDYKSEINRLKGKRKRKYNLIYDELTGEKLRWGSQFSHIRAKSAYPAVALNIENGLIVNKEIHAEITKRGIANEEDLLVLCKKNRWNTSWYKTFKRYVLGEF